MFEITERLVESVKHFEGYSGKAYWDADGKVWTIGFGRTGGVKEGDTTTRSYEDGWLRERLKQIGGQVERLVTAEMTQGQFEAFVSFVYNMGLGSFNRSHLLRRFNDGDAMAHEEFDKWVKSGGRRLNGLVRRRNHEKSWFLESV